jgi:hypothetical protein
LTIIAFLNRIYLLHIYYFLKLPQALTPACDRVLSYNNFINHSLSIPRHKTSFPKMSKNASYFPHKETLDICQTMALIKEKGKKLRPPPTVGFVNLLSPFTKPLKPAPKAGSRVKRRPFTGIVSFHRFGWDDGGGAGGGSRVEAG